MKKLITSILCFILISTSVFAYSHSVDLECQNNGFSYGIHRYDWVSDSQNYALSRDEQSWVIMFAGDQESIQWSSKSPVAGVLVQSDEGLIIAPGGHQGSIETNGIRHVSFCADREVPEFGLIALIVLTGILGIFVLKKRGPTGI